MKRSLTATLFRSLTTTIVGLLLLLGCNEGGASSSASDGGSSVRRRLESAVASGATTFDFAADATLAWDRMFVFDCYSSQSSVENALGFKWPEYRRTSIELSDSVVLVVFVQNGKVTCWYEQPRSIELGSLANKSGYLRSQARFEIARDNGRVGLQANAPALGAAKEAVPATNPAVGLRVTYRGIAQNRKIGAYLDGPGIYVDLPGTQWPSEVCGKPVEAKGTVVERHDLPVFVDDPNKPPVSGIPVPPGTDLHAASRRLVLEQVEWKIVDNSH